MTDFTRVSLLRLNKNSRLAYQQYKKDRIKDSICVFDTVGWEENIIVPRKEKVRPPQRASAEGGAPETTGKAKKARAKRKKEKEIKRASKTSEGGLNEVKWNP